MRLHGPLEHLAAQLSLDLRTHVRAQPPHQRTQKLLLSRHFRQVRETVHGHADNGCLDNQLLAHDPLEGPVEVVIDPVVKLGQDGAVNLGDGLEPRFYQSFDVCVLITTNRGGIKMLSNVVLKYRLCIGRNALLQSCQGLG